MQALGGPGWKTRMDGMAQNHMRVTDRDLSGIQVVHATFLHTSTNMNGHQIPTGLSCK